MILFVSLADSAQVILFGFIPGMLDVALWQGYLAAGSVVIFDAHLVTCALTAIGPPISSTPRAGKQWCNPGAQLLQSHYVWLVTVDVIVC